MDAAVDLSTAEKELIERAARQQGLSPEEYIRKTVTTQLDRMTRNATGRGRAIYPQKARYH